MSLREDVKKQLQVYRGWTSDEVAVEDLEHRADELLALILKKLPEKQKLAVIPEPSPGISSDYCHGRGHGELVGYNQALSEVRSILESPPPDPTNEELSKLTLEDLT